MNAKTEQQIKRHAWSAVHTFTATFALVLLTGIEKLLDDPTMLSTDAVTALMVAGAVAGARAVTKIAIEYL